MIRGAVEVDRVERISPSFVRVELAAATLEHFGTDGPSYDQRVKLVFPDAAGRLPAVGVAGVAGGTWYERWLDLPAERRGHMRTYTVRDIRGAGTRTRLVVDFVVHGDPPDGPGAAWASRARPGDRLLLLGPRRGEPFGGIEFAPGEATELLLVGDETAVPAIASILSQLAPDAQGQALLEVPWEADLQPLHAPDGVEVCWLPRAGAQPGSRLVPAVRQLVGLDGSDEPVRPGAGEIWETPSFSGAGGEAPTDAPGDRYAWIAGESGVVRTLRRCLVDQCGWNRADVAFMGYWRQGVSMRS